MIGTRAAEDPWPHGAAVAAVRVALAEDATADDVTTRWSVPADTAARARIIARQPGVAAGLPAAAEVFRQVDPAIRVELCVPEGAPVGAGDVLVRLAGPAAAIVTGERVALNFLQRMCGIATMAARLVAVVGDRPTRVLDTRKTAPGLRALDKYAVRAGGATPHRPDLSAMILLKENHLAAAGGVTPAVDAVRRGMAAEHRQVAVEVEVATLDEAREALAAGVDWVLLDNMTPDQLREAVRLRDAAGSPARLEASGLITLDTAADVAATGVDAMSVGALTHSVRALDLSLLLALDPAGAR